jgi:tetratricopeptide (TPR) repeat protein
MGHAPRPNQDRDNVLFGRPDRLKVFISSEMRRRSLEKERVAAAEAADEHPDAEAWVWERSAHPGSYSSLEVCRGHAATSDLLILIVSDTLTYATEIEWRAAKYAGVSCAIFVKEGVEQDTRLSAFLEAERDISVSTMFRDVDELKRRVGETLRQSHTSAIRKGLLQRRRVAYIGHETTSYLFEAGLESAEQELWSGSAVVAAKVVSELENLFGDYAGGREDLDLLLGQVHATLGDRARATEAYERIVASPGHTPIGVAIAQQNLGLEALKRRDFDQARELMRDSLHRHSECENWFGVLQILINLTTLAVAEGQLTSASKLVDLAEQLISEIGGPIPHQETSLQGLRAHIAAHSGRPSDALTLYRRAWKRAKQLGDREAICVYTQNIGSAHADLKRPVLAKKWYERALLIAKETCNAWRQEELHGALAKIAHKLGNYACALEHLESARALATRMSDDWLVAIRTADIGAILALIGDSRATGELDRAANLLDKLEAAEWLYRVEQNRGELARRSGDRARAVAALGRALKHANSDDDRRAVHESLAFIHLDQPVEETAAVEEFIHAADCATQVGSANKAWLIGTYATYLSNAGCQAAAIKMFDRAISIAQSAGEAEALFHLRNDRSLILINLGDLVRARDVFQDGATWARTKKKRSLEVQALHNLGETQRRLGDLAASRRSLQRAVELSEKLGDNNYWRSALALLAITELAEGSVDEAEQHAASVRDAARRAKDRENESSAIGTLAGVQFVRGNYGIAAQMYSTASRLNQDQPNQHCEDLMGMLEARAAADDWLRTRRVAQRVADYAQEKALQHLAWPSLLRAARRYLDRGNSERAGVLATLAFVLAQQSEWAQQEARVDMALGNDEITLDEHDREILAEFGQLINAMVALAFHVKLSGQDSASRVWQSVLNKIAPKSSQFRDIFSGLIDMAQQATADYDLHRIS